jgi:hypothetical protein
VLNGIPVEICTWNNIHYHFTYDSFKGEYKHSYKQGHTESVPPHKFTPTKVKKTPLPCCIENNQNNTKVTPKKFGQQITINSFMRAIKFLNLHSSEAANMCAIRLSLNFSQIICTRKCSFSKFSVSLCHQRPLYSAGQVKSTCSN